jgi:hypothetical protein
MACEPKDPKSMKPGPMNTAKKAAKKVTRKK